VHNFSKVVSYTYDNEHIISEVYAVDNSIKEENYFKYSNDILIKDSAVINR